MPCLQLFPWSTRTIPKTMTCSGPGFRVRFLWKDEGWCLSFFEFRRITQCACRASFSRKSLGKKWGLLSFLQKLRVAFVWSWKVHLSVHLLPLLTFWVWARLQTKARPNNLLQQLAFLVLVQPCLVLTMPDGRAQIFTQRYLWPINW